MSSIWQIKNTNRAALQDDIKQLLDAAHATDWVGDSTAKAFRICGYTELAARYKLDLIDLQKDPAVTVPAEGGTYQICRTIADLDKDGGSLINVPVLKGHGQTLLTCALKNLKGCIPDSEKRRYHSLGVHDPVAILNSITKPAFSEDLD